MSSFTSKPKVDASYLRALFGTSLEAFWIPTKQDGAGNVLDLSGNGLDGTANSITEGDRLVPAIAEKAGVFDGGNINFGNVLNFGSESFTVGAWITTNTEDTNQRILSNRNASGGWVFYIEATGDRYALFLDDGTSADAAFLSPSESDIVLGETSFFAAEIDRGNDEIRLWINGELKLTEDLTVGDFTSPDNLVMGRDPGGGGVFRGQIQGAFVSSGAGYGRQIKELSDASGVEEYLAPFQPGYVSAYPTAKTIELGPDFYISSAGEPDAPAIDAGDETPTNQGSMFGATSASATQSTASNQPIWRGPWTGWDFVGDDYWEGSGFYTGFDAVSFFVVMDTTNSTGTFQTPIHHGDDTDEIPQIRLGISPSSSEVFFSYQVTGMVAQNSQPFSFTKGLNVFGLVNDLQNGRQEYFVDSSTPVYTASDAQPNSDTSSLYTIGAQPDGLGGYGQFLENNDIKEIIIFDDEALSSDDAASMMDELIAKWGI